MFSLFLAFSFLSWTVSKLSQSYDSWVTVELTPTNLPDSLFVDAAETHAAKLRLRATGFKLFGMGIGQRNLKLDLSTVSNKGNAYYLTAERASRQLQKSISNSAELLDIDPDTLYFDLFKVKTKKIPVISQLELNLEPNHILKGKLKITPDSIIFKGPEQEIDTINKIVTSIITLSEVADDFSVDVDVPKPNGLANTDILNENVTISGTVVRFSEKVFEIPVSVNNVPEGYVIRTFPKSVSLLCKASENDLINFTEANFDVMATYDSTIVNSKELSLRVAKKPENALVVRLLQNTVEFLLEPK